MSSWGSTLLRHLSTASPLLIAGCSAAPPPEPAPPLPPPPASAPVVVAPKPPELKPDPPGVSAGMSEFRALQSAPASGSLLLGNEELVAFGKGVLSVGTMYAPSGQSMPECMVANAARDKCRFLRVAPWSRAPVGWGYLGAIQESTVGAWSGLLPVASSWSSLSAGREVAYAVHSSSGLTIDTINEKGEVTQLMAAPAYSPDLSYTHVVEMPSKMAVVGVEGNENELMIVPVQRGDGGKSTPGEAIKTGIFLLPPGATAAWARGMIAQRRKAGYGSWAVAPSLDAKGEPEGSFYLAWTEVIPPAKYTPAGVAPKKRGAKNGCGRGSRSLADLSVEKRVHVVRFQADGKRVEDRVVSGVTFTPDDEELKLTLIPTSYGYVLNGAAHGRDGQIKRDAPVEARPTESMTASPPLPAPPIQRLDAAEFDQKRGEGIILFSEDNRQLVQRFDGTGEPMGDATAIDGRVLIPAQLSRKSLASAGGTWAALERTNSVLQVLNGPLANKRIVIPADQSWVLSDGIAWALPFDDESIEIVRYVTLPRTVRESMGLDNTIPGGISAPLSARVNLKTGEASPWQIVAGWFDGEKKPRLPHLSWIGRGNEGQLQFFGFLDDKRAELHQLSKDEWAKPITLGDGARVQTAVPVTVWKDQAILFDDSNSVVSWLGKGLTVQVGRNFRQASGNRNTGPWLRPGDALLPGEASEPVKLDAEAKKPFNNCPASFATGPRRAVLVCIEAPDTKTPGARVGTRVVRF